MRRSEGQYRGKAGPRVRAAQAARADARGSAASARCIDSKVPPPPPPPATAALNDGTRSTPTRWPPARVAPRASASPACRKQQEEEEEEAVEVMTLVVGMVTATQPVAAVVAVHVALGGIKGRQAG